MWQDIPNHFILLPVYLILEGVTVFYASATKNGLHIVLPLSVLFCTKLDKNDAYILFFAI